VPCRNLARSGRVFRILIRSLQKPRANWDASFKAVADTDDDQQLAETPTAFEKKEWQW